MNIVNVTFTKVSAEKTGARKGNINVNNNINLEDLEQKDMNIGAGKKALQLTFSFKSTFKPSIGTIALEGNATLVQDKEDAEKTLNNWEDNKNLGSKGKKVIQTLMKQCSIKSIVLSREVGLPNPLPLNFKTK